MNRTATLAAIKALPGMTARYDRDASEYRVTFTADAIAVLMPHASAAERRQRAEDVAAYASDSEDAIGTARAMSGQAIADAPALPLSWRDECYGSVYCAHAFRLYDLEPHGLAFVAYRAAIMRAGFTFHYGRCSWIAADKGADVRLCDELKRAGFTISAGDKTAPATLEA